MGQEYERPRVLKFGELGKETRCWFEARACGPPRACRVRATRGCYAVAVRMEDKPPQYLDRTDYGFTWRCWDEEPTEEARTRATWA